MKKTKKVKESPVAEVPAQPQIDPVLIQKVQALRAIATTHNLLDKGLFNHSQAPAVTMCLDFLRSLHEQVKTEALTHPDAIHVPELQAVKGESNV